jgi:DNA-binding transcriptional LysR family regulator
MTRFHGLDLNLLVTLEVLLVERNLTRAADRLSLTQPAISNALTRLRDHFDDELLVRSGREMERTPFAQQLFNPLQEVLQQLRGMAMARPNFEPLTAARRYKIVASDFIATVLIGDLILQLERSAPHVELELLPLNDDSIGKISRGEADAIIWPAGQHAMPAFTTRDLFVDQFVCIAGTANTAVGSKLSAEEFHALKRVEPPYKVYWPRGRLDGENVRPVVRMPFSAIPWFIAGSDYVAIVPGLLAAMHRPALPLRTIELSPPLPKVTFCAQCHPESMRDPFKIWMLGQLEIAAGVRCRPNADQLSSERAVRTA